MSYESGLAELAVLIRDVTHEQLLDRSVTEADTRAKVIDRILIHCLGWTEPNIHRETHSDSGYADYILRSPQPMLVVEAKRSGDYFAFPIERERRSYALGSLRSEGNGVGAAIQQVRRYADDHGIEYACATNGTQWLIFRSITPGEPWVKGSTIVFRSLEDIHANFTEFWNLLSRDAVSRYSLRTAFSSATRERPSFQRALDDVLYADAPLQRNKLSTQLQWLISALFKDLTGEEQNEVLRNCYVVDRKVQGVSTEVRELFNDTVPAFADRAGFQDLVETKNRSGALDSDFKRAVERGDFGTTVLLLGGIGAGKTTFIHRFFRITAKEFVDQNCVWFYVPFTDAPLDSTAFSAFLRKRILLDLGQRYRHLELQSVAKIKEIYADSLQQRREGLWSMLTEDERRQREVAFLEERLLSADHCDAVLQYLRKRRLAVTIVLDNVDQRDPAEQLSVFLLAHELCRSFDAIIIVALREESFFKAEQAGAFNAYHNIRYHIASPDTRTLLQKRVDYALDVSSGGKEALRTNLRAGLEFDASEIRNFMRILKDGALKENPAICQFIDAVSQGNMRAALDMFNQFMVSGTTNVDRMLQIYRTSGRYNVAEHEFIKAVMSGDFQFYKEERSRVINVFEASSSADASNLTTLRILEFLARRSGHSHAEGNGFVEIDEILRVFNEIFGNTEDAEFHLNRLIYRRLIEADNRQVDGLRGVRYVRTMPSGLYYANILTRRFQYLDMVSLDTPIWDRRIMHELKVRATSVDMYERFYRVEWLLTYLRHEEERTLATASREMARRTFGDSLVGRIEQSFRVDVLRVARGAKLSSYRLEEIRADVARASHGDPG